ncbi:hypothetical protein CS063_00120 [Sporanaerobium hydrogeniformans]|uniref:Uncharacterized protein n=1 Tax=Sporanaerobium hydrogeniformans TaxID=3072179 RepID=A0AC61DG44_9FIRM|nr:hypothetical protein [Sporanaerobium hydrogeniformans]PHV71922.1 hypothetical protein CS063_00120 [Sporanaerobium hydrogeniformans]
MFSIEQILLLMGVLVFLVTAVVEVTKKLVPIKTDYYVLGVSVLLSVLSYLVYVSYNKAAIIWYYIVGAITLGFLVAYVSMFGWEKFIKLWEQSRRG